MSTSSREPELRPGGMFGSYEIVRALGSGGYGTVYEALKLPLRKRTALKVLHREHTHEPDLLDRFLREAEIVAQVEHPHIVTVFDVGVHDAQPYIAMELLDGESLADLIDRGGPMSPAAAVDVMLPVLSAVSVVHAKGVVHRDLKPDNIFLARPSTGGTVPKLLDFGIAKVRDAARSLTVTRAIMGTPNYMSPEQARESKHVDGQSDQWALAVIVFECLTGVCPFQGENLLELLLTITSGPTPRLRDKRPDLPGSLEAVLLRAMAPTPDARWPSVRAFGEALLPFATDAARAQWSPFFTSPITDRVDMGRRSTVPAGLMTPREETLAPATLSSQPPPGRPKWQRVGLVGAVAVAVGLLGIGGLALRTPPARMLPVTAVRVRPAVTTSAPSPVVAVHADAGTPAAPAVVAAPVVAAPVVPAVAAASPVVEATEEATPTRRHRRHHGRHRSGEPAASGGGGEAIPNF